MKPVSTLLVMIWLAWLCNPIAQAQEPVFTKLRTVSVQELNQILTTERDYFIKENGEPPDSYVLPTYQRAKYAVDVYRVQYTSSIPEQDQRSITAFGLIAIPQGIGTTSLPMVSYQHGTVFGRYEVPSYAFVLNNPQYDGAYETRLMVAQFASQGYAVIAADYFGLGDSTEPEAFTVKSTHQQACLDLYLATLTLLDRLGITKTDLLLAGWSQGGLVTLQFLERLERETAIPVTAASTAAAPADPYAAVNGFIYHRREIDAEWLNAIVILTAFSYENYYLAPADRVIRAEYLENSRRLYERDYRNEEEFQQIFATIPTDLTQLLRPEYANAIYLANSDYGHALQWVESYRWPIATPMQIHYGMVDEVISLPVARLPSCYQKVMGSKGTVIALPVTGGNHRGTFLTAVKRQKNWFDTLLSR